VSDIRQLDDATIRKIAAGEVVERPASVVKELVENSLDADASRVSVAVERGGKAGIRVRDDGVGMTAADLERAVDEHTTSKIADVDDLEAGVDTLGFRGEALYTIGAVSTLTVRSKPRAGAEHGHELVVEDGDAGEVRPAGCPSGTVVEVEDLFATTPARKKFLKTDATEFDHVNRVVTQYALANPDVAVSLEHDDREVFATEGRGSLESTVLSVYGREVAESMVSVDYEGETVSVAGVVSHPETNRSGREYLSTFVNDRYVTDGALRGAVLDAYGGQLAPDRYPFAVLFVEVPPDGVDVNVHPRKTEVRFDDEAGVTDGVEAAVREALLDAGLVRTTAPRGRSARDETPVEPSAPDAEATGGVRREADGAETGGDDAATGGGTATGDDGASATTDRARPTAESAATTATTDRAAGPERDDATGEGGEQTAAADDGATAGEDGGTEASPTRSPWTPSGARAGTSAEGREGSDAGDATASEPDDSGGPRAAGEGDGAGESSAAAGGDAGRRGVTDAGEQRTLMGETATPATTYDRLPTLRVLGQYDDTYVVAASPDGLVLVDQHAADERVNYERLREAVAGDTPTQALADPVELELTAREAALFESHDEALARVGFHAGRTGERTVEVRTVPAVFDATVDPERLRDALSAFASEEAGGEKTVDAVVDSLLADLACYPSITGNTSLTEGSVVDLLAALDDCENPYACPHGRPVVVAIDDAEIAERFERDYPGHAGRRAE
jgi:DNA mismatch repair protein MutL